MTGHRITLIILWGTVSEHRWRIAHAQTPAQRGNAPTPTIISGSNGGFLVER
jgi:hypothetical protein